MRTKSKPSKTSYQGTLFLLINQYSSTKQISSPLPFPWWNIICVFVYTDKYFFFPPHQGHVSVGLLFSISLLVTSKKKKTKTKVWFSLRLSFEEINYVFLFLSSFSLSPSHLQRKLLSPSWMVARSKLNSQDASAFSSVTFKRGYVETNVLLLT